MLTVRFIHIPKAEESKLLGPFEWVVFTYSGVRAGSKENPDGEVLGAFSEGLWHHNKKVWTDINIEPAPQVEGKQV